MCTAALAFAAMSCDKQSKPPSDGQHVDNPPATNRLPTATEVFDLRSKCAALGEKILEDNKKALEDDIDVTQDQVSHYNPETNHCYVKLVVLATDRKTPREKNISHEYLYDGQTKEMLAYVYLDGNQRSGHVFSESLYKFVHSTDMPSYEETSDLINKFVAEDRRP